MNMLIIVSSSLFLGSSSPYPFCMPLMTYIFWFGWIVQWPGKLILKDFQVHSAFPESASSAWKFCSHGKKGISLFQLSGTLTYKPSRNLQEMAFVCLHIKIDLWWVQPLAFPALSLGGIWIGEMRWLFLPTGYREPGEPLSVSAFRWLKCDGVNSMLGVMQNTLNCLAWHVHPGFCTQFLSTSGVLWRPDPSIPPLAAILLVGSFSGFWN